MDGRVQSKHPLPNTKPCQLELFWLWSTLVLQVSASTVVSWISVALIVLAPVVSARLVPALVSSGQVEIGGAYHVWIGPRAWTGHLPWILTSPCLVLLQKQLWFWSGMLDLDGMKNRWILAKIRVEKSIEQRIRRAGSIIYNMSTLTPAGVV
jgi:hypothetical protein